MKSLIKTVSVFTLAAFLFLVPDLQAATWSGVDLSNGGALTQITTVTLAGGETVTITQPITGSNASLTITGAGTLALDRDPDAASVYHTYTGPTIIADGTADAFTTLKVNKQFTFTNSSSLTIGSYGVLDLRAGNALGYYPSVLKTINLNGNATITTAEAGATHSNLGTINVTGTGNQIIGTNAGSGNYGNFFFAGEFTLADNSALEIKTTKMRTRIPTSAITKAGVNQSGIFNVGANATLTVNPATEGGSVMLTLTDSGEGATQFVKKGAGTMTLNGTLDLGNNRETSGKKNHQATVEAGTLNVTKISGAGQFNQTGGKTVADSIDATGPFVISGGELEVTNSAFTFDVGGNLTMTDGKLTTKKLYVAGTTGEISGGALNVSEKMCLSKNTEFLISGGNNTVAELSVDTTSTLNITGNIEAAKPSGYGNIYVKDGGSMNITGDNAGSFGGTIYVSGSKTEGETTTKSTLNLDALSALYTGTIDLNGGVLSMNASNAMYYFGNGTGLTAVVKMKNGAEIVNTLTDAHSNLGMIEVSGTGNKISASGNGSGYGNFFFAGKITLAENADLTMDLKKVTLRRTNAGVPEDGKSTSGVFDVGTGATINANIPTMNMEDATASFVKKGAGTMNVSGIVSGAGKLVVEAGTLNLNGKQTYTGATTISVDGLLGTGTAANPYGTLDLTSTKVTLDGGKIVCDVSGGQKDAFTFGDLELIDGAEVILNWFGDEEMPESLELDIHARNAIDEAGNILTAFAVGGDFAGYRGKIADGTWLVYSEGPEGSAPEPASWLLLLLGLAGLGVRKVSRR